MSSGRPRLWLFDKPFTNTFREAQDLDQLARSEGRVLSVFQNRRWDGDFLTVRKLLGAGTLGRLALFESHYDRYRLARRPGQWREDDGPAAACSSTWARTWWTKH